MKRTLYLFSVTVILTLIVSLMQTTSAPAQLAWTPTPTDEVDPGSTPTPFWDETLTPTEWSDPGSTPTPFADWTLTPIETIDPDSTPTPWVDWTLTPFPQWTLTPVAPRILYVNQNAMGANTGTSWVDAFTDLQSALSVAFNGSEIWVAAGTYKPTASTNVSAFFGLLKNGVAIYGGFLGNEGSRDQRDPATHRTILSGDIGVVGDNRDNTECIVVVDTVGSSTILDGFTITGANNCGIANIYSDATFANLMITNNSRPEDMGYGGGGMLNYYSNPTLTNVTFESNTATYAGAGMHNDNSNPILSNVIFNNNVVTAGGSEGQGGAIYNAYSNPTLENTTFRNNYATKGGGIYNYLSAPTIRQITFNDNSAVLGGAMYNTQSEIVVLTNVTFFNNSAYYGGALYNDSGWVRLNNVTLSRNSAQEQGGGIYSASNLTVNNTIIWGNTAKDGPQIYMAIGGPNFRYSVIQGGCPVGTVCTHVMDTDPRLGSLADNGGFTRTMALLPGSSAIDAGEDATCSSGDQRRIVRPQGAHCDIGAYELEQTDTLPPVIVSIQRADPDPTHAAYVDFTVTFSEEVTGVDARDFVLKTFGGIRGATIAEVTGSGSVYTVTVKTGRSSGKLRLDVPVQATITDLPGNPLESLPFQQGEVYRVIKRGR